jgi:hypothetical protein
MGYIYRGGDPLRPAPGEVASGVAPLGEAAPRRGGTRGGAPPETLMGCLPCNPSGPALGEATLGVAHPCNPNGPAAPL